MKGMEGLELPEVVTRAIDQFVAGCTDAFGADLVSVVLFGSAAEGRLRPTSDVNAIVVVRAFAAAQADRLRGAAQVAHAAVQLSPMFLLDGEVAAAAVAFAVKFDDVLHRHRVLYGRDPFAGLDIPRAATLERLRQVLLNQQIRLREAYVLRGDREEQLALMVADAAGPLRSAAAAMCELEGRPAASPRAALEALTRELPGGWAGVLQDISQAREQRSLPPGRAAATLLRIAELTAALRSRADELR